MKNNALILISTLFIVEILTFLVHQIVMQEPYIRAYILIPIFFLLTEGAFLWMSSKKWSEKMSNMWFFIHKTIKLIIAILLIGIAIFAIPEAGIAFYIRFIITYFVFLIIETMIGVKLTKNGTK